MKRSFTRYPVIASQGRGTVQASRNRRNPNKYTGTKNANRRCYSAIRATTDTDQMLANIDAVVQKYRPDNTEYIVYDYSLDNYTLEFYASGAEGIENYEGDEDLDYDAIMDIETWVSRVAEELAADDKDLADAITENLDIDWYSGMSIFGERGLYTYDGITYIADI